MHDVITKTLPADPLLVELARLQAKHGEAKLNAAGLQLRTDRSLDWTPALLGRVDEHLCALDAQTKDTAMLERDEPKAKPAPAAEDPLAGVRAALAPMMNWGAGFEASIAKAEVVLDEVRKIMGAKQVAPASAAPAPDNGLLISHNPDRRLR